MPILGERYFRLSNAIFCYGLTPDQFSVYSYLICCAGSREKCWPSVRTIAANCRLSENTVRKAIAVLVERGFIRKVATKRYSRNGKCLQWNNNYFIRDLPPLPKPGT